MAVVERVQHNSIWRFTDPTLSTHVSHADLELSPGMIESIRATAVGQHVSWADATGAVHVIGRRMANTANGKFSVRCFLRESDVIELDQFVARVKNDEGEAFLELVTWRFDLCRERLERDETTDLMKFLTFLRAANYVTRRECQRLMYTMRCENLLIHLRQMDENEICKVVLCCTSLLRHTDRVTLAPTQLLQERVLVDDAHTCCTDVLDLISVSEYPVRLACARNELKDFAPMPVFTVHTDTLEADFQVQVDHLIDEIEDWPIGPDVFGAMNTFLDDRGQRGEVRTFDDIFVIAEAVSVATGMDPNVQFMQDYKTEIMDQLLGVHQLVTSDEFLRVINYGIVAMQFMQRNYPRQWDLHAFELQDFEDTIGAVLAFCNCLKKALHRPPLPPRFLAPVVIEDTL